MADRGVDDFSEVFHDGQHPIPQSSDDQEQQYAQILSYPSVPLPVENYAYPLQRPGQFGAGVSTDMLPPGGIGDSFSNPIFAYAPASGNSMPVAEAGSDFTYNTSTYSSSAVTASRSPDHEVPQFVSLQSQASAPNHGPVYLTSQAQEPGPSMYWEQPQSTGDIIRPPIQNITTRQSRSTHPEGPPRDQAFPRGERHQTSTSGTSHRYIRPKQPLAAKADAKPEAAKESSQYTNIYSSSGFDMMGILAQVVSRPDPKINFGAVDLSCAFLLCDITRGDDPIVYVSHAFERLTGYTEKEILGRNCRFLQSPDGEVERGSPRKFVDQDTAFRFRRTIDNRTEIQASIINYRKGGQPFLNLITMVPVRWNSEGYRFFLGLQVDLVEKPDAVRKRNPDGSYMIDYQRSHMPRYVVPAPDMHVDYPDSATQFEPGQVAAILDTLDRGDPATSDHIDHVLVENTDDMIHVLSFEGEFLYLSPSCRKVLEYGSRELVGKTLSTICHPSDIGPVTRAFRACTSTEPVSVIYRVRRKHSGYAWLSSHGAWHISERGRQFMVLVGRIVPVYSLNRFTGIERGGLAENDLWVKLSLSGLILFMSSKSRAVLGRAPDDLINMTIQDIADTDSRELITQALETACGSSEVTVNHRVRHRRGHMLPARTTIYPGDTEEGVKPSFLVAQLRFPALQPKGNTSTNTEDQTSSDTSMGTQVQPTRQQQPPPQPPQPRIMTPSSNGESHFTELNPARGSNWQVELRSLEKENRSLADEVQRLLARKKKRQRKQSATGEKSCAVCGTQTTPEWRRGPSGNRDLCNSCGLRWAKQVRSAQTE